MLFQQPDWGADGDEPSNWGDGDCIDAPRLSALTWGAVKTGECKKKKSKNASDAQIKEGKGEQIPEMEPISKKSKRNKKKKEVQISTVGGLANKAGKLSARLGHGLAVTAAYKLDKFTNSPSATETLLDKQTGKKSGRVVDKIVNIVNNVGESGKEISKSLSNSTTIEATRKRGQLLMLGEKFTSHDAFLRFIGLPGKGKRGKKRQRGEEEEVIEDKTEKDSTEKDSTEKDSTVKDSNNDKEDDSAPVPPPRKKKRGGVDIPRLREVLARDSSEPVNVELQSEKKIKKTLAEEAKLKLSASRFRYLNEQLYTQPGNASAKLFRSDPTLFPSYHQGFQHQAEQWPLDPLNTIIADCLRLDDEALIADFGCGEARLARSVENKVYSFDLVALNERVTACDMANVPLEDSTVDVAVFCLSLMGTNIRDFLFEAARVLKVGGTLKIAELESRFQGDTCNIDTFIENMLKFGFKNTWKDLKKDFFYFLDFKKVQEIKKKKGKLPEFELKPCLYKKR